MIVAAAALSASFAFSPEEEAPAASTSARATPVAVASVEQATITERQRYPGELDADAADVAAFYSGRLKAVRVRVGDRVSRGDVLAEIDPVDVAEQIARARAQAEAAGAEQRRTQVELEAARKEFARHEAAKEQVSALALDAARARAASLEAAVASASARAAEARAGLKLLERQLVESTIRAPFSGRIAARYADPGVIVSAGTPLVRLVAIAPLYVRFQVPEAGITGLAVGTPLRVETEAGGADVAARITGIAGEVDRVRRIALVEALVEKAPSAWLPGMYADVIVERRTIEQATVVPANAVLSRLQPDGAVATGVLVADGDKARWVPVKTLAREGDRVAVQPEGPLEPGTRVLVAGHVDLVDGSLIKVSSDQSLPVAEG